MFAVCCRRGGRSRKETARETAFLAVSSVAVALSASWLLTFPDMHSFQQTPASQAALYAKFFPADPSSHALGAVAAIPNSIAPPSPSVVAGHPRPPGRYRISFTLEPARDAGRIAAVWIPLLIGGWLGLRSKSPVLRAVCLGSVAILLYNLLFHAVWGREWFLYSQHWLAPAVFLMVAALHHAGRWRFPAWLAASIAIILITSGNRQRLGEMVSVLEAESSRVPDPIEATE
jgi:hypothetical protein